MSMFRKKNIFLAGLVMLSVSTLSAKEKVVVYQVPYGEAVRGDGADGKKLLRIMERTKPSEVYYIDEKTGKKLVGGSGKAERSLKKIKKNSISKNGVAFLINPKKTKKQNWVAIMDLAKRYARGLPTKKKYGMIKMLEELKHY